MESEIKSRGLFVLLSLESLVSSGCLPYISKNFLLKTITFLVRRLLHLSQLMNILPANSCFNTHGTRLPDLAWPHRSFSYSINSFLVSIRETIASARGQFFSGNHEKWEQGSPVSSNDPWLPGITRYRCFTVWYHLLLVLLTQDSFVKFKIFAFLDGLYNMANQRSTHPHLVGHWAFREEPRSVHFHSNMPKVGTKLEFASDLSGPVEKGLHNGTSLKQHPNTEHSCKICL